MVFYGNGEMGLIVEIYLSIDILVVYGYQQKKSICLENACSFNGDTNSEYFFLVMWYCFPYYEQGWVARYEVFKISVGVFLLSDWLQIGSSAS